MNLAQQPIRSYSKEQQLTRKRARPTQRQMGEISQKVDRQLKERSGGVCERCNAARATERAHITGRKHIEHRTTVNDLMHLCTKCHDWLDETPEGIKYKRKLRRHNHESIHR